MTDQRIRVTEAELKRHWFGPDATGMIHDHQTRTKVVRMEDGTEYETPFSELSELTPDGA
jgi:small-conductance mechanosensitive channel